MTSSVSWGVFFLQWSSAHILAVPQSSSNRGGSGRGVAGQSCQGSACGAGAGLAMLRVAVSLVDCEYWPPFRVWSLTLISLVRQFMVGLASQSQGFPRIASYLLN